MFENNTELFAFLQGCKVNECTVLFENEGITVSPVDDRMVVNLHLSLYMTMKENQKMVGDYLRYLTNINKMKWAERD